MWPYLPLINKGSHAVGNKSVVVEIMVVLPDTVMLKFLKKKSDNSCDLNSHTKIEIKEIEIWLS